MNKNYKEAIITKGVFSFGLDSYQGWVIEGLLRDAVSTQGLSLIWISVDKPLKMSRILVRHAHRFRGSQFIIAGHRSLNYLSKTILKRIASKGLIFVTQFQVENELEDDKLVSKFNLFPLIVVQNQYVRNLLISSGVKSHIIKVFPGGVDKNRYFPKSGEKTNRYILISGDFKLRKNPEGIISIVRNLTKYQFVIHGKNLEQFKKELLGCSNVSYRDFSIDENANLMRNAMVYLCVSKLEGGPIPILEALSSGTPVISTPVGFVPDLNGIKGLRVIPQDFHLEQVQMAIEELEMFESREHDLLEGKFSLEELGSLLIQAEK